MSDSIEWELRASNGTVIKVTDVVISREVVDVPDVDRPGWVYREVVGPIRVSALVSGTEALVPSKK